MLTGDFPVLPRSGRSPKERSLYLGGKTMNKTELIAAVAEKAELSKKDAEKAVKAFTDAVAEENHVKRCEIRVSAGDVLF